MTTYSDRAPSPMGWAIGILFAFVGLAVLAFGAMMAPAQQAIDTAAGVAAVSNNGNGHLNDGQRAAHRAALATTAYVALQNAKNAEIRVECWFRPSSQPQGVKDPALAVVIFTPEPITFFHTWGPRGETRNFLEGNLPLDGIASLEFDPRGTDSRIWQRCTYTQGIRAMEALGDAFKYLGLG